MSSEFTSDLGSHSELDQSSDETSDVSKKVSQDVSESQTQNQNNRWILYAVVAFLAVTSIFFIFLTVVFALLYFQLLSEKNDKEDYYHDGRDDALSPILGNMKSYSFSQKNKDNILEGVLFLPNNGEEFSYNDKEEDLTYAYFEVDLLEEKPQEWKCRGTCHTNGRRFAVTLPTVSFYLFSVVTAAAVSYYLSEIKHMDANICGDEEELGKSSVTCEMEEKAGQTKSFYYKCGSVAVVNDEQIEKASILAGLDLSYIYEETDKMVCGDDASKHDIATETVFAKDCFKKIIDLKNDEFGSLIYKTFLFDGCHKHEGVFSEAAGAAGSGGDHHHSLKSCELCDLDPSLDYDI